MNTKTITLTLVLGLSTFFSAFQRSVLAECITKTTPAYQNSTAMTSKHMVATNAYDDEGTGDDQGDGDDQGGGDDQGNGGDQGGGDDQGNGGESY
ncbi:hypothetical protein BZZ01_01280 [Nostocales cyanobacterium HT-58-2]|nr:hypothetical protein BZZ01_01280 [Nostocales cyanobacterium HT-58-2]